MKKVSHTTKIILGLALLSALLSLSIAAGFLHWIEVKKAAVLETKVNTERARAEQEQLTALERLAGETKDDRMELSSFVVTEASTITFLALIEDIAKGKGATATTKSIATVPLEGSDAFESLLVELELVGPRFGVSETIKLYEALPYQVRIVRANLERRETELWQANLSLSVTKSKP